MTVEFRRATAEDSEFAFRLKKMTLRDAIAETWGWDEEEQRQLHERRFGTQDFQVIQADGVDVGILATVRDPDCLKVNQLLIAPEFQRRRVGTAALERVIEAASAAGLPVRLRVMKSNPHVQEFYLELGFTIVGETDTHVVMERAAEPAA